MDVTPRRSPGRAFSWQLALCWLLTAAAMTARTLLAGPQAPLFLDSDDAMRLNMVHDLLAGQDWFDLVQHRLNTPYGGEMHWSRLVDLPEALVLLMARGLFGATAADRVLGFVWPLLLLLPLLWLSAKLALRLGGRGSLWPALVLPAFSLITIADFAPGRLDHHSVQILLALVMLVSCIGALERPRLALLAGAAAALAIAVAIEGLPMVAAAIIAMGVSWVCDARQATAMRDFGLSFATVTVLALAIGVAPDDWLVLRLDAISIVFAVFAVLVGAAFTGLSLLRLRSPPARLAAGAAAGLAVALLVLAFDPAALKGPYAALDPWLVANWLDRIGEARPWLTSFRQEVVYPVAVTVPVLMAIGVALWKLMRVPDDRLAWGLYLLFLVLALGITVLQIRGARLATPLAVPGCAVLVAAAWRWTLRAGIGSILVALAATLASAGIAVAVATTAILFAFPDYAAATEDRFKAAREACLVPQAFDALRQLPPQRIMAPVDLGAHLLLYTPHSVVAAPYHRNQEALLDALHFFTQPGAAARAILARRGIGLVVVCPALSDIRTPLAHAPDSFVALYAEGRLPDWLTEIDDGSGALRIYAVRQP